ncbi:unnamed protein product [Ambrosiozyma monospora]|uniref:Unnamed protein product n=1 Tax=Ambrosiozyma monospora TaxID=43982 RepID=A0ACB5TBN7_AMBMO|nr:unnamed protein product [Ambrosiozyma monospora]
MDSPFVRLLYFKTVNDHTQTLDFGVSRFPPHLQVFDIYSNSFEKISFIDGLPSSILIFTAYRNGFRFYDELTPFLLRDESQIEDLKKQFKFDTSLSPWYKWVFGEENEIE